jgi:hypothetical protein
MLSMRGLRAMARLGRRRVLVVDWRIPTPD